MAPVLESESDAKAAAAGDPVAEALADEAEKRPAPAGTPEEQAALLAAPYPVAEEGDEELKDDGVLDGDEE